MHKISSSIRRKLLFHLLISLFFASCAQVKLSALAPKNTPAKKTVITNAASISQYCPQGIEACAGKILSGSGQLEIAQAQSHLQSLCEHETKDPKLVLYRQSACFEQAKIDAAQGRTKEAAALRRKACDLDMKFCLQRMLSSYNPNFFEAVDLAAVFCPLPDIKNFYVNKLYFSFICSFSAAKNDSEGIERAWVEILSKAYVRQEEQIRKVRMTQKDLTPELDFTSYNKDTLDLFYGDLRKMKFPRKVKFNLYKIDPVAFPMDIKSDATKWLLSSFSGGLGKGWKDRFAGYVSLPTAELIPLARKFPFLEHQYIHVPVTGTIVGYLETGVVPVPVIVLDEI